MSIGKTTDLNLVDTAQIVDGSVTSAKIGAGAVVAAKISSGSVGTVAISSGSATSGQILQANGSGGVAFATPAAGGGMTLIATATPSAATSLSFSSIPTTYKHLVVRWLGVFMDVNTGYWNVRVNGDTASNYNWHFVRFVGITADAARANRTTTTFGGTDNNSAVIPRTSDSSIAYDQHGAGSITFYDYASTTLRRNIQSSSWGDAAGGAVWTNVDGYYASTGTAITSITFVRETTEAITGTFFLYGVS